MRTWSTLKKLIWLKKGIMKAASWVWKTVTGSILHITDALAGDVSALSVAINPAQSGSGDPAPDNVRPISGWTEAKVTRTGKNLLQLTGRTVASSPGYDPSSIRDFSKPYIYIGFTPSGYCNPAKINSYTIVENSLTVNCNQSSYGVGLNVSAKPSTAYVFSFKDETQGEAGVVFFGADGKRISAVYFNQPQNWAFTTPADCENMMLVFYPSTTNADKTYELPQLELGSTAHDYEPYSGTTITIDLDGTIYGGTLDVLTGVLTVTHRYFVADGVNIKTTGGWGAGGPKWLPAIVLSAADKAVAQSAGNILASYLKTSNDAQNEQNTIAFGNSGAIIPLHIGTMQGTDGTHGYNSAAEVQAAVNAYLAENSLQVWYKLAAPQTVQLTPSQLSTLLGENYIWADTGNTTMTYMAQEA